jgi:hypothetical protein
MVNKENKLPKLDLMILLGRLNSDSPLGHPQRR